MHERPWYSCTSPRTVDLTLRPVSRRQGRYHRSDLISHLHEEYGCEDFGGLLTGAGNAVSAFASGIGKKMKSKIDLVPANQGVLGVGGVGGVFFKDVDGDGTIDASGDICALLGLEYLPEEEQSQIEGALGPWVHFNERNTAGHYRLNLGMKMDRLIATRLLALNNKDANYRRMHKLEDASQSGNWRSCGASHREASSRSPP